MSATTPEDTSSTIPLVASDPDGDPLAWTVSATPAHGTAGISGATLTYDPARDFHGTDTVGVTVSDGRGGTASTTVTITVTITVTPVNDPPTATGLTTATARDTGVDVTLLGADVDGDPLTYVVVDRPAHGSVLVAGDVATYTPAGGYVGPDSFTYVARDPAGATSAPATVSITVTGTNRPPVATAVESTTREDVGILVPLAATDPDYDALRYRIVEETDHGTVGFAGDAPGVVRYTPEPNFHGTDVFTWSVSDGTWTVLSTATITVTSVNDAPVATHVTVRASSISQTTFVLPATDVDGDDLRYTITPPLFGRAELRGDTVTYTPSRADTVFDTIAWTVSDGIEIVSNNVSIRLTDVAAGWSTSTPRTTRGDVVTTTIRAAKVGGRAPTGRVTLLTVDRILGSAPLREDGTAVVTWRATRAGTTLLAATYAGDDTFAPAVSPVANAAVVRSASRPTITAGVLKRGRAGVVRVAVATVAGAPATGRVTVAVAGTVRTVSLVRGVAVVRVAKLPRAPRLRVAVRYAGDSQYAPTTAARIFPTRR